MKVVIVGGGIGGMSLALSLCAAGLADIDVYESAPAVRELGVGINVLPHAVRELAELGLQDELSRIGVPTADYTYYSRHGQQIWREPLGIAAGYRWPQLSIHRGELLGVLHRAVLKRLGPGRIHTNHQLSRFGNRDDGGIWAEFIGRDAAGVAARAEADLLVGCDGIHSTVRNALYPKGDPLRWNGVLMWRGVSQAAPFLSGRSMVNIGSSKRRTVVYPISLVPDQRNGSLINWVATCQVSTSGMPPQDWTNLAERERVVETFADFTFDFLDVVQLIRDADVIYQYPMVDKDPLPSWNFGRTTLLGDAAHPMHPVGGNGASQAILDARVLARELASRQTIESALSAYDSQRRPATAAIAQSNRKAGPHRCQDLVEERAPDGFNDILDVMTRQELEGIADDYKLTTGSEIDRLNNRESLSVPSSVESRPEPDASSAP
ncbi:flavin-dependent oxidoreductase [Amycolatopsis benzoatilytica]|uniref:flavin-dependent oxidoreductase n=1 Tax=Amycolatopsis benzoatilytica TaxID=346045 RepID=UPI0003664B48|nr:flavin-dependent oxidoreductase [Amycolatopsis benzoatilytica]